MKTRIFTLLLLTLGLFARSLAQDTVADEEFPYALCPEFSVEAPAVAYLGCPFEIVVSPVPRATREGWYYYRLFGPGIGHAPLTPMPYDFSITVTPTATGSGYYLILYREQNETMGVCQQFNLPTEVTTQIQIESIEVVNEEVNNFPPVEVCCGNTQNFIYNESYCFGVQLSTEMQLTLIPEVLGVAIGASVSQEWCVLHGVENACTAPEDACINLYRSFHYKDVVIWYTELDCDGNPTSDAMPYYLNNILSNVTATCSPMPHPPDCSGFTLNETHVHPTDNFFNGSITVTPEGGSGTYEYFWSHNQNLPVTTNQVSNLAPGFYTITVTDVNECCTEIISVELINCDLDVEFYTYVDEFNGGLGITANEIGGNWDPTFEWNTGEWGPFITAYTTGDYCVTVTDSEGCVAEDCYEAYCEGYYITTTVEESWYPGEFNIYPSITNYSDRDFVCYWEDANGNYLDGDCSGLLGVPYGEYTLIVWDGICTEYEYVYIEQPCFLSLSLEEDWADVCVNIDGPSPDWTDYDIIWEVHNCEGTSTLHTYYDTQCAPITGPGEYCVGVTYFVDDCYIYQTACLDIDCFNGGPSDALVREEIQTRLEAQLLEKLKQKKEQSVRTLPKPAVENIAPGKFEAYPNPFNDEINITFEAEETAELSIELLDVLGRAIQKETTTAMKGNNNYQFKLEKQIPESIYFLRITDEKGKMLWTNKMLFKNLRP